MLDAACPGHIFTSPTPDQMAAAAIQVDQGRGVLFIVKNYSGDVMNFEMAAELVQAEGVRVSTAIIDDDVAVKDSLYTQGRRGMGTTVLAEKICGAAAVEGYDLQQLSHICQRVNTRGRSIGVALTPCTVPEKGAPTFTLAQNAIEYGIGIHGEPGRERTILTSADELVERMTLAIIEDPEYRRRLREWNGVQEVWTDDETVDPPLKSGDEVLALVNDMGGTPLSEIYLAYRKVDEVCWKKGLRVVRRLVGAYITSLDMQGISITLLRVDEEILRLWDAPVVTPGLRWGA
jgi:dihydroxyacetone kinase-like protein